MKKIPQRALSLCLMFLLAAGLLMAPAFADAAGGAEDEEITIGAADPDTKCVTAGGWTWDLSLVDEVTKDMSQEEKALVEAAIVGSIEATIHADQSEWAAADLQEAEEGSAQARAACSNPSHPKGQKTTYAYGQSSDTTHSMTITDWETCSICFTQKFLRSYTTSEAHTFDSGRYVSSNHTGAYTNHTHTYAYTCVSCKYVKNQSVSAGCTVGGCAGPYSLTEPPVED